MVVLGLPRRGDGGAVNVTFHEWNESRNLMPTGTIGIRGQGCHSSGNITSGAAIRRGVARVAIRISYRVTMTTHGVRSVRNRTALAHQWRIVWNVSFGEGNGAHVYETSICTSEADLLTTLDKGCRALVRMYKKDPHGSRIEWVVRDLPHPPRYQWLSAVGDDWREPLGHGRLDGLRVPVQDTPVDEAVWHLMVQRGW